MLALAVAVPLHAQETIQVPDLSCTKGQYRAKLPASYKALRGMGQLKRERTTGATDHGTYKAYARELRFVGLEVIVVTFSNSDRYVLSRMTITAPKWKIGGQFRVGSPAKAALRGIPIKDLDADAEIELSGDGDSILVTFTGGRVEGVEYSCHTD
jgi:hypothetical protein